MAEWSPALPAGRQVLCFFPDRLLVFDKNAVGAVAYDALTIESAPRRFIEEEAVPVDSTVVDHTWRYVNKKGGPDKRFKNNRQLPVCLYEEITVRSASGLNEALQVSKQGIGERLRDAVGAQFGSQEKSQA